MKSIHTWTTTAAAAAAAATAENLGFSIHKLEQNGDHYLKSYELAMQTKGRKQKEVHAANSFQLLQIVDDFKWLLNGYVLEYKKKWNNKRIRLAQCVLTFNFSDLFQKKNRGFHDILALLQRAFLILLPKQQPCWQKCQI